MTAGAHGDVRWNHSITLRGPVRVDDSGKLHPTPTSCLYMAYCECGCVAVGLSPKEAHERLCNGSGKPEKPGVQIDEVQISSSERQHANRLVEKLNNQNK